MDCIADRFTPRGGTITDPDAGRMSVFLVAIGSRMQFVSVERVTMCFIPAVQRDQQIGDLLKDLSKTMH